VEEAEVGEGAGSLLQEASEAAPQMSLKKWSLKKNPLLRNLPLRRSYRKFPP
jgi:dsRNA-specific ribonuclease